VIELLNLKLVLLTDGKTTIKSIKYSDKNFLATNVRELLHKEQAIKSY
jgi:hypothetical protein